MGRKKKANHNKELPCHDCGARCCRYIAVEIDTPKTKREYDDIRWYLLHDNISVFVDHDGAWHIEIQTPCRSLANDHSCREYETRPQICRDHGRPSGTCEFFDSPYNARFHTPEEYERYLDRKKIDWRYKRRPRGVKKGG